MTEVYEQFRIAMQAKQTELIAAMTKVFSINSGLSITPWHFMPPRNSKKELRRVVQWKNYKPSAKNIIYTVEIKNIDTGRSIMIHILPGIRNEDRPWYSLKKDWDYFLVMFSSEGYKILSITNSIAPILAVRLWKDKVIQAFNPLQHHRV